MSVDTTCSRLRLCHIQHCQTVSATLQGDLPVPRLERPLPPAQHHPYGHIARIRGPVQPAAEQAPEDPPRVRRAAVQIAEASEEVRPVFPGVAEPGPGGAPVQEMRTVQRDHLLWSGGKTANF